uniref:BED-type domain-containing protein n=1 Tax=Anopheles coluzzii TaxID=1518534 RepID=A0A6E8VZM6_ANOCL
MPGPRSNLWSFFTRDPTGKTAKCALCNQLMSVEKSTYSNLRRHILRKHPSRRHEVAPRQKTLHNAMWKHFSKEPEKRAKCRHCGTVLTYKYTTSSLGRHMQNKHVKILLEEQQSSAAQFEEEYEEVYEEEEEEEDEQGVFPVHSDEERSQYAAGGCVSGNESDGEMECGGGLIELQPVKNDGLTEPIKLEIVDLNPEPTSNDDPDHELIEGSIHHHHHHQSSRMTQYDEEAAMMHHHHHHELGQADDLSEVIEETVIGQIMGPEGTAHPGPADPTATEDEERKASAGCLISSSMKHINTKVATFAVHTALEMESLAAQQRIIAQKLVSDILFNAKLDNLDENSLVIVRVGTFERE